MSDDKKLLTIVAAILNTRYDESLEDSIGRADYLINTVKEYKRQGIRKEKTSSNPFAHLLAELEGNKAMSQ